MRRIDRERNDAGGGRGFRVLEAGGRYLEPLSPPPPPRAPEPYKVAPPSSSLGRAHRRSSFVIIAETRPPTPSSASPSPTLLATGRVSPFRGRGFKGPLPHAQSRPQSPENHQSARRRQGRFDRTASVSQQSSPKRSLIPQPTRRRSVSLTKSSDRKPSPKFGRRAAAPRKNANGPLGASVGNLSRRQSLRAPDLSPIQGTPTKPVDTMATRVRGGNSLNAKVSPMKSRNSLAVPKNYGRARGTSQDRSPVKGSAANPKRFVEEKRSNVEDEAPTKIPMRRGSVVKRNGTAQAPASNRFAGKTGKPGADTRAAPKGNKNEQSKPETNVNNSEKRFLGNTGNRDERKDDQKSGNDAPPASRFIEMTPPTESKKREDDLGLIDLLKQSSGATGTSSVVNTTTTTAVQPLQIEAAAILLENDRAKTSETSNGKSATVSPSPASSQASPNPAASAAIAKETASLPKIPKTLTGSQETGTTDKKTENKTNETAASSAKMNPSKINNSEESTAPANTSLSKKEPNVSTPKNSNNSKEKTNGKDQGVAGVSHLPKKSVLTRNGIQDGSRGEMRVPSANPASRISNANNNNNHSNNNNSSNNVTNEQTGSGRVEPNVTPESVGVPGKQSTGKVAEGVPGLTSGHRKTDSKGSTRSTVGSSNGPGSEGKRALSRNVGAANAGIRATANGAEANKFPTNHGSEASLKSSNGLSAGSVDSIRSTDTGVSVNTVRGVSSAREKKGMHMMKKSDEIETLSGNVMHLERNGEPAVLDIADEAQDQTRLGRFKKSLARFNERLPSMRCLGCRRGRKGHAWLGEQRNSNEPQAVPPAAAPATNATTSGATGNRIWTNLKSACRCTRLRECKCCRRAARVAPAESAQCCPPERSCGALCRRLFSRCKCNKSEAERTRSIRAKHSLTSVAPPPLSEEQRSKIPEVLVEHNSVMRGAIPCLPVPLAWFCLVWNILFPGSGTVWSGFFNLCMGQPRFAVTASPRARFGALVVNLIVGVGQLFTVLFCLVGWGWSIWWGVMMIRLARKYRRFRASEAASGDLEARAGESTGLPPGVPSQALRGMERAR